MAVHQEPNQTVIASSLKLKEVYNLQNVSTNLKIKQKTIIVTMIKPPTNPYLNISFSYSLTSQLGRLKLWFPSQLLIEFWMDIVR